MSEILLNDILKIPYDEIQNYKVKLMVNNGYDEPLTTMTTNYNWLLAWIGWKGEKDDLTRPRVISFVRYYTVSYEQWIFAGIVVLMVKKVSGKDGQLIFILKMVVIKNYYN